MILLCLLLLLKIFNMTTVTEYISFKVVSELTETIIETKKETEILYITKTVEVINEKNFFNINTTTLFEYDTIYSLKYRTKTITQNTLTFLSVYNETTTFPTSTKTHYSPLYTITTVLTETQTSYFPVYQHLV